MHQNLATSYHGSPTDHGQDSAMKMAFKATVWSMLRSASRSSGQLRQLTPFPRMHHGLRHGHPGLEPTTADTFTIAGLLIALACSQSPKYAG